VKLSIGDGPKKKTPLDLVATLETTFGRYADLYLQYAPYEGANSDRYFDLTGLTYSATTPGAFGSVNNNYSRSINAYDVAGRL
jgi:hypothetical protein